MRFEDDELKVIAAFGPKPSEGAAQSLWLSRVRAHGLADRFSRVPPWKLEQAKAELESALQDVKRYSESARAQVAVRRSRLAAQRQAILEGDTQNPVAVEVRQLRRQMTLEHVLATKPEQRVELLADAQNLGDQNVLEAVALASPTQRQRLKLPEPLIQQAAETLVELRDPDFAESSRAELAELETLESNAVIARSQVGLIEQDVRREVRVKAS